jgi:hypothetical protein
MKVVKTLSTNGSTRGTAYAMSNKIITAKNKIFITWLDFVADIKIQTYDIKKDSWDKTVLLGKGVDNHSGPALTMDSKGYLYAVYGPHHGPFQIRKSKNPYNASEWEPEKKFSKKGTYPSLICGPDDTLYCTYRDSRTNPWRLLFQSKPKNGKWSKPKALVDAVIKDYAQFGNPIAVAKDGTLHLGFHIYNLKKYKAGRMIGYLRSEDKGKTWKNAQGRTMKLPVTEKSDCFIEKSNDFDMRIGNIVLDAQGNPWLTAIHLESNPRTVILWHLDNKKWKSIDLIPFVQKKYPDLELQQATMTFDKKGTLYVVVSAGNKGAKKPWGHPSLEILLLTLGSRGRTFKVVPVSKPDPKKPNWLPSIERPFGSNPIEIPSLIYTHGGPGKGCLGGPATEINFVRLTQK